jgi:hypothetical protein
MVAELGMRMPRSWGGRLLSLVRDLLAFFTIAKFRALVSAAEIPRGHGRRAGGALANVARGYERLAHILYFENQPLGVTCSSMRALVAAGRLGPSSELARVYGNLVISAGLAGARGLAWALAERSRAMARAIGDEAAETWAFELEGVIRAGIGDFERARVCFETAMAAWGRIGDRRRWEECLTLLGMTVFQAGDGERARALRLNLEEAGHDSRSAQTLGWAYIGQAEDHLARGDAEAAVERLEGALALGPAVRRVEQIWLHGLLARAQLLRGDHVGARAAADASFELLYASIPTAFYIL